MTSIYLVRHGEYTDGKVNGEGPDVDLGLSIDGRANVAALAARLAAPESFKAHGLYSSPLPRAVQTAQAIAPALGLAAVVEPNLEEWRSDDGRVNQDEFMSTWRSLSDRDRPFHRFVDGYESGIEFSARVQSALHCIVKQHADQSVVLVVHGGVIQVAFQYFFGYGDAAFRRAYPAAGYTSITHWRQDTSAGKWILESSNDMHHVPRHGGLARESR
jgi:broad specificity phosphatase PhoE